ncbi:c-type cytochrome [Humitalea sp. 24SJ18S-53]|uniref:c-type cytochrome n=1 Tax=Humitalea sp. 24SJ18S-53 TaxID=3422307 RepID=UPI003D676A16
MPKIPPAVMVFFLLAGSATAQESGGDAAAGQRVFNQCRACHSVDRNLLGPNLRGVVGRSAASVEGFRYSAPMRQRAEAGLVWTEDTLRAYVRDPKAVVPGGSMAFAGLRNDQQVTDVIAYLREQR